MEYRGLPRNTEDYHEIPRIAMEYNYHGIPRITTEYPGLPQNTEDYRGIPRITMDYGRILLKP
jgi:hypothetical protein